MEGPFGGEGDEDLLALSRGGMRPHGGSLPFERGCDGVDIVMGLFGHEGEGVVGGLRRGLHVVFFCVLCTYSGG